MSAINMAECYLKSCLLNFYQLTNLIHTHLRLNFTEISHFLQNALDKGCQIIINMSKYWDNGSTKFKIKYFQY